MPILDIQKRARELGRIRIGQKGDRGQPQKLDRFRLTSASRDLLERVAELYGGEVKAWTPRGGAAQWEVVTTSTRIPILVPPQPVTQWMETWSAGGCTHRCDGQTNVLTDELCDPDDPAHAQAKPTTRLNVVLRDVEGIGVWRLETHGWNAAAELPQAAEFLAQAGGYVDGFVALEQRTSKRIDPEKGAQTRHFLVPVIHIAVTPAELLAGGGRITPPTLEGPIQRPELAAPGTSPSDPPPAPEGGDDERLQALNDFLQALTATTTVDDYVAVWQRGVTAKLIGPDLPVPAGFMETAQAHGQRLQQAAQQAAGQPPAEDPGPDPDGAYDAVVVDDGDPDALWDEILKIAGDLGLGLTALQADYTSRMGHPPVDATAGQLASYRDQLAENGAA